MWEKFATLRGPGGYDIDSTYRLKVPGGWLVRVARGNSRNDWQSLNVVYVPDPNHSWTVKR